MRNVVAGVAAVVVVAVVAGVGWWLLEGGGLFGDEAGETAEATVEAYLDAWAEGRHTEMVDHLREPSEDVVEVHDQLRAAVEPEALTATITRHREDEDDGRALTDVELRWEVAYADDLVWEVELEVLRQRGEWAIAWDHSAVHPQLRPGLVFDVATAAVERAPILARDGTELAGPGERITLGFEPSTVEDADELAEAFDEAVPGTGDRAASELGRGDLVDDWFYPVVTLSSERGEDAWADLRDLPGVLRRTAEGRSLLDEGFAQHVVGLVAEATAEQLEELGEPYEVGDEVGRFGLEAAFERELVGSDEVTVSLRDGEDGPVRETILTYQADPSAPLETTLDVIVQRAVENALVGVESTAAVVVVDAEDGAVRASASRPLSDYNRAFAGSYAPGSTFKVVTLEALLADGMNPDDEVTCPEDARVGGLGITNAGDLDLGTTTLREAFAASCNTTFAPLATQLGVEALTDAARRFGFGWEPDLGLSARGGVFAEPEDDAALGAAAFGQARVSSTPLHLASVAAATERGTWHPPYLLADRERDEPRDLAEGVRGDLRELLRAAVTDGTGTAADVARGVRGKTGTAQAADDVEHAWFIGTYEGLGFAVLVEEGGAGGRVAAPIAGRLVRELESLLDDPGAALPDDADGDAGAVGDGDGPDD
jgi:cell division protein FtsI/penicillin-binding protein 2